MVWRSRGIAWLSPGLESLGPLGRGAVLVAGLVPGWSLSARWAGGVAGDVFQGVDKGAGRSGGAAPLPEDQQISAGAGIADRGNYRYRELQVWVIILLLGAAA